MKLKPTLDTPPRYTLVASTKPKAAVPSAPTAARILPKSANCPVRLMVIALPSRSLPPAGTTESTQSNRTKIDILKRVSNVIPAACHVAKKLGRGQSSSKKIARAAAIERSFDTLQG